MKLNFLSIFLFALVITSCGSTKSIQFTPQEDEIVTTDNLKSFLNQEKNPKVVLRATPNFFQAKYKQPSVRNPFGSSEESVTEEENVQYIYNAIENTLLEQGFIVRDRQLFNQIVQKNNENLDYSKLSELSDTDLIIELVKLDPSVIYETNIYYDKNGEQRTSNYNYNRFGATIEYKVIMIKENEFAGVYEFNYAPCIEPCTVSMSLKDLSKNKNREPVPYEGVERDLLEEFVENSIRKLVSEMRE